MKVYLVFLSYDIMFDDSDYGDSYAGEGRYDLKIFDSEDKAKMFIDKYQEVFQLAFKENKRQVFPRLTNQQKLKDDFDIDLYSIEPNMDDLKLNYKASNVE